MIERNEEVLLVTYDHPDNIHVIHDVVCKEFEITEWDFMNNLTNRQTKYKNCRYFIWLFARIHTSFSYPYLAGLYGKNTHASVLHGVRTLLVDINTSKQYRKKFFDISHKLMDKGYPLPGDWEARAGRRLSVDKFLLKH